jgi:hypothetical protein
MTYQEIYDLEATLLDKSGVAYFDEGESDKFTNLAKDNLVEMLFKEFERTQILSDKLSPLKKSFTFINKISLNPSTDFTNYLYWIDAYATKSIVCSTGTTTEQIPIKPLAKNSSNYIAIDPFNKPSTRTIWMEEVDGLFKFTTTDTLSGGGMYLKKPLVIDTTNSPNVVCEFNNNVCNEIAIMACILMAQSINDLDRAKILMQQLAEYRNGKR